MLCAGLCFYGCCPPCFSICALLLIIGHTAFSLQTAVSLNVPKREQSPPPQLIFKNVNKRDLFLSGYVRLNWGTGYPAGLRHCWQRLCKVKTPPPAA